MEDLKSFGTQQLSPIEMKEVNGGLFGIDDAGWVIIGVSVALGIITTQDLDDLKDAFSQGYDAARN